MLFFSSPSSSSSSLCVNEERLENKSSTHLILFAHSFHSYYVVHLMVYAFSNLLIDSSLCFWYSPYSMFAINYEFRCFSVGWFCPILWLIDLMSVVIYVLFLIDFCLFILWVVRFDECNVTEKLAPTTYWYKYMLLLINLDIW